MTATAEGQKIRYRNRDTNRFEWDFYDNLPDYAKEQLAAAKNAALPADGPEKVNDYSADIEQWTAELRLAVESLRASSGEVFTRRARAETFKQAIDVYRAAEYIPAVMTQFGSYRADFHFRVPPAVPEYDDISPLRHGTAHRYLTADPVEIAYLRMLADYEEVPVGSIYGRASGQRDGTWDSLAEYERKKAAKQVV